MFYHIFIFLTYLCVFKIRIVRNVFNYFYELTICLCIKNVFIIKKFEHLISECIIKMVTLKAQASH